MRMLALVLFPFLGFATQEPQQQSVSPSQSSTVPQQESTTLDGSSAPSPTPSRQPAPSQAGQSAPNTPTSAVPQASQSAPASSAPLTAPGTLLKVTTRMVLVDVVVSDNSGRPITDLKVTDFDVRENGKSQKIAGFAFQQPPPQTSANTPYKPVVLPVGVFTNLRGLDGAIGPPTILLVDALNTPTKDQAYLRQQLVKYLEKIEPRRNVAIYTLGTRLRLIQDFTSDPELLHAALKKVSVQSSMFNDEKQDFQDEFPGLDPDSSDRTIALMSQQLKEFQDETEAFQRDVQIRLTLDAMKELANNVAGYPGRKNLVWLSGSFPLTVFPDETSSNPFNNQRSYGDDLRKTAAIFSADQIAVYPVDARGLVVGFMPDASQRGASLAGRRAGPNAVRTIQQGSTALQASHESMNELAGQTGGHAFYNRNDIDHAIALSVAEGSTYYTLGYYPDDQTANGRFRKIEVKVDRKGIQSHYRKGYFAVDTQTPDERIGRAEFVRALAPDAPITTSVPFLARVTPPTKEHKEIAVDFSVLPRAITFEPEGELEHAEIEFVTRIFDTKGKAIGETQATTVRADLKPATYKEVMVHGLRYHQAMNLPPGKYVLKLGVRDHKSNMIGTLAAKLEVPQG